MKAGTMYDAAADGSRFTLVRIAVYGDGEHLDVWDVEDVETGAVRRLDEDEIFAAGELPAQVGQAWIDEFVVVTLTSCRRNAAGGWSWDVFENDGHEREIDEAALLCFYARVDGLDLEAKGKEART